MLLHCHSVPFLKVVLANDRMRPRNLWGHFDAKHSSLVANNSKLQEEVTGLAVTGKEF